MVNHCPNTPLVSDTKMEAGFSRPARHAEGMRPTLSGRRDAHAMSHAVQIELPQSGPHGQSSREQTKNRVIYRFTDLCCSRFQCYIFWRKKKIQMTKFLIWFNTVLFLFFYCILFDIWGWARYHCHRLLRWFWRGYLRLGQMTFLCHFGNGVMMAGLGVLWLIPNILPGMYSRQGPKAWLLNV